MYAPHSKLPYTLQHSIDGSILSYCCLENAVPASFGGPAKVPFTLTSVVLVTLRTAHSPLRIQVVIRGVRENSRADLAQLRREGTVSRWEILEDLYVSNHHSHPRDRNAISYLLAGRLKNISIVHRRRKDSKQARHGRS
jgi:hypothetical protein